MLDVEDVDFGATVSVDDDDGTAMRVVDVGGTIAGVELNREVDETSSGTFGVELGGGLGNTLDEELEDEDELIVELEDELEDVLVLDMLGILVLEGA